MDKQQAQNLLDEHFSEWVLDLGLTVVETRSDGATLRMEFADRLNREGGILSGQAIMALADTAIVIGLFSTMDGFYPAATVNMNTYFLRAAKDSSLLAHSTVIKRGRTMAFAEAEIIMESNGKTVATTQGSYALPPVPTA